MGAVEGGGGNTPVPYVGWGGFAYTGGACPCGKNRRMVYGGARVEGKKGG